MYHPIIDRLKTIAELLPNAIGGGGEEVFTAPVSGMLYKRNTIVNINQSSGWAIPLTFSSCFLYQNALYLETITISAPSAGAIPLDNNRRSLFYGCTSLRSIVFDFVLTYLNNSTLFYNCTALESVQFGNVGKAAQGNTTETNLFTTCPNLQTITFYVNAETLADVPTEYTSKQPFGAPNASVVYRSSTTGEVITA